MGSTIGFYLGTLLAALALTIVCRWLLFWLRGQDYKRLFWAVMMSLAIATIGGGFGLADQFPGRDFVPDVAFMTYLPAHFVVLVLWYFKLKGTKKRKAEEE